MSSEKKGETSAVIRERVIAARRIQSDRFGGEKGVYCNAQMDSRLLKRYAKAEPAATHLLGEAMNRLNLSARAYDKVLRVARTFADLAGSEKVRDEDIKSALGYRRMDEEESSYWA